MPTNPTPAPGAATQGHTPGPWRVGGEGSGTTCTVFAESGDTLRRVATNTPSPYMSKEECEANARLIAAAPDLLSALTKLWGFYQDLSKSNPGFMGKLALQDYAQWSEAVMAAPAAIAKATGGAA